MAPVPKKRSKGPRWEERTILKEVKQAPKPASWANEALAVFLYGLAAFLLISFLAREIDLRLPWMAGYFSLSSFSAAMGPAGFFTGATLSKYMGLCGLVPVIWTVWLASYCWETETNEFRSDFKARVMTLPGLAGLLLFSCTFAAIFAGRAGGGSIGLLLAVPLVSFLSKVGASIITGSLLLICLALATRSSIRKLSERGLQILLAGFHFMLLSIPRGIFFTVGFLASLLIILLKVPIKLAGLLVSLLRVNTGRSSEDSSEHSESDVGSPEQDHAEDEEEIEYEEHAPPKSRKILPLPVKRKKSEEPDSAPGMDVDTEERVVEVRDYSDVKVNRRINQKPPRESKGDERKGKESRKSKGEENFSEEMTVNAANPLANYVPPPLTLLSKGENSSGKEDDAELKSLAKEIEDALRNFRIQGRVTEVHPGPVITLYEFEPAPGIKVGQIASLTDDLAMSLRASSIRIIAPIPRRGTVGIEVPNKQRDVVRLRDLLESEAFQTAESMLSVPLGKDTSGDPVIADIATMPHLLMAGATGTGKSVSINALLVSMLYRASPAELGLILIDPKILELSVYEGIPHLRVPVVTVPKQARAVLDWAVKEMDRRYRLMQRYGVRNIDSYNRIVRGEADPEAEQYESSTAVIKLKETQVIADGTVEAKNPDAAKEGEEEPVKPIAAEVLQPLPKIVIVIDELADLMMTVGKEVEDLITRLAQKARASGIHLIVATQRPSVDVITGLIKANIPARLSFRVTSKIDSRTILDSMGAEQLLGRGDMLFMQPGANPLRRIHGAYVSDTEVKRVVGAIKEKFEPCYDEHIIAVCEKALVDDKGEGGEGEDAEEYDSFYDKAVELVMEKRQASTSMIQRAFRIGYNRAARIIEMMEKEGVVGPPDGAKPREVLVPGQE
jgi:DNA segregation ATPase FtsK/SpoIIIE, S-DNA-T family